ncbi:MAG: hypothetical protein FRX49_09360 [Trebouxia sp. A1-2]|nr:MAG: hypothetical protein FRX49_12500 [Trebouxia sp. A1-2]KAA6420567.1 MAG: hypothetical protein FRX49_09360 [Trebouxia sp. A1-2]
MRWAPANATVDQVQVLGGALVRLLAFTHRGALTQAMQCTTGCRGRREAIGREFWPAADMLHLSLLEDHSPEDVRFGLWLASVVVDDLLEADLLQLGNLADAIDSRKQHLIQVTVVQQAGLLEDNVLHQTEKADLDVARFGVCMASSPAAVRRGILSASVPEAVAAGSAAATSASAPSASTMSIAASTACCAAEDLLAWS